jgi:hypothetical protein
VWVRVALTSHHDHGTAERPRDASVGGRCGIAPLSGKRHYLTETIPAGPCIAEVRKARRRLIGQVDEQRNPAPRATVGTIDAFRLCCGATAGGGRGVGGVGVKRTL